MGVSMSTLGGWSVILCIAGYYAFRHIENNRKREAARAAAHKHRLEDKQNIQSRKDVKDKAKRQRGESYSKEAELQEKVQKPKPRTTKPAPPAKPSAPAKQVSSYSSEDDVDNREFARQLASVKQGTNFSGPKKGEEKRQKSVKQSRAQEQDDKVSAPSSTAGADADDDQSPMASPEVHASNPGGVSDMLERPADGPSILRLTDTDKATKKDKKKAKAAEKTESKKQRQNRQKVEAAKVAREEAEAERKVKMEAQRRLARISEGRAAKDGSTFTAAQNAQSAWSSNNNGTSNGNTSNGGFVQPLDTFNTTQSSTTAPQKSAPAPSGGKAEGWLSSIPSEEEQMEMLREEEAWSTVKPKKSTKAKKDVSGDEAKETKAVSKPEQAAPVASKPVVAKVPGAGGINGKKAPISQQSSFAALTPADEVEAEEEWDV